MVTLLALFTIFGPALSWNTFLLAFGQFVLVDQLGPSSTSLGSLLILIVSYALVMVVVAFASKFIASQGRRWLASVAFWCFAEGALVILIIVLLERHTIVIE